MKKYIDRLLSFIIRENLHKILLVMGGLLLLGTIGMAYFEPERSWADSFWWSIVTLTTVGYGDIAPTTLPGRIIGGIIMILGIGILGMFTATIASIFVENKLKADRGMSSFDFENHIILCGWNYRAQEILNELRSDMRSESSPIILIANIESKPMDDENLYFIRGDINEENLNRANLANAKTVIILGNDAFDASARDAHVVLAALTVESLNPDVYTIVELVNEQNVPHCERANADEIIVGSKFSSRLISRAALDHGISKVLSELLTPHVGSDLSRIPVPQQHFGKSFLDVFMEMKRNQNSTVLGIYKQASGVVISNPAVDYQVVEGDQLIVISEKRAGESVKYNL